MIFNQEDFPKFPKINSLYKRDDKGNFTTNFSKPEFKYLYENKWIGTEKIHGTNIRIGRVIGFSETTKVMGRGNNSQIPHFLNSYLYQLALSLTWEDVFSHESKVVLFGEGYGKGIQDIGNKYNSTGNSFILFDVWIDGKWLSRENVEDIASTLGIDVVPVRFKGNLGLAERTVSSGFNSAISEDRSLIAEGLVLFPEVQLKDENNNRIITKLKVEDYK